jgi:hypothetical protein
MLGLRETIQDQDPEIPRNQPSVVERFRPLRNAFVWLLTTAGAVIIGAIGTSYFERSSPISSITEISISSQFNDRFGKKQAVKVPRNESLFRHLEESEWLTEPDPRTTLSELIKTLETDKEITHTVLEQFEAFRAAEKDLKLLLSSPASQRSAEMLFDKWQPVDWLIYMAIFPAIDKGELVMPTGRDHRNKPRYLVLNESDSGNPGIKTHYVSKRGNAVVSAITAPRQEREADARAIAEALAFFDQDTLGQYVMLVDKQLQSFSLHEVIKKELPETLRSYSRWSVATLISNSGSHSASFSSTATLYIDTQGTKLGPGYTRIDLESRLENEQPEPVVVEGNKSRLVHYISRKIVRGGDSWQDLLSSFDESSLKCFIVLHPQSDFWRKTANLTSSVRAFGPTTAEQVLPDKEIEAHFRQ